MIFFGELKTKDWILVSLEFLDTLEVIIPIDSHGVDQLLSDQLPGGLGALHTLLLGLLDGDNLAVLECNLGSNLTTVRGRLFKLLVKLEKSKY